MRPAALVIVLGFAYCGLTSDILAQSEPKAAVEPKSQPVLTATDVRIAQLETKVDLLAQMLQSQEQQRQREREDAASTTTWLFSIGAGFVTVLVTFFGWFISSRMKEPEEFRETLRAKVDTELAAARDLVKRMETETQETAKKAVEQQINEIKEFFQKGRQELLNVYSTSKKEAGDLEAKYGDTLKRIRELIEIGEPPGEKLDADALYYMAEHIQVADPLDRRVRGLRFLRRLADPATPANPVVLHNAAVRAKEYDAQELGIALFKRAAEESGHVPEFESSYAHELALTRRTDEALRIFDQLISTHSTDPYVAERYLDAMRAIGEHSRVRDFVEKHKDLLSECPSVMREYGDYLLETHRHAEAEKYLKEALAKDPGDDITWVYLYELHRLRGEWDEARKCIDGAITASTEASPRLSSHFLRLGSVLVAQGKRREAQIAFLASQIAERIPSRAIVWLNILERQERLDQGLPLDGTADASKTSAPPEN